MAPNLTVTNSDANTTIVQFNLVTQLPIKLTGSHNFFLWKAQLSMLMCGHNRLGRLAKETLHVADYLYQVQSLYDELSSAGAHVSNEEMIVKILTGLGPEFREISASIRARESTISYLEVYEKLLDHEHSVKHEESKKPLSTPITAALTQQTNMHPRQGNTSNRRSNANSPNTNQSRRA
ncbi:hypothetical protein KY284_020377 [Solanum tuberosum]|nr:hypothetical protein KY284_020377 [Solanum tuberosum]